MVDNIRIFCNFWDPFAVSSANIVPMSHKNFQVDGHSYVIRYVVFSANIIINVTGWETITENQILSFLFKNCKFMILYFLGVNIDRFIIGGPPKSQLPSWRKSTGWARKKWYYIGFFMNKHKNTRRRKWTWLLLLEKKLFLQNP